LSARGNGVSASSVLGVLVACIAFELMVFLYGESPREMLALLYEGTWGSVYGLGQVLYKATPLFITALAVDFGLRAGLFNIGTEGQLSMASLSVAVVGAHLGMLPGPVGTVVLLIVAATAGALYALLPALLKVRFGAHEVISTIMTNRVADGLVGLALGAGLALPGTVQTAPLAPQLTLTKLQVWVPGLAGSSVSTAVVVAAVTGVAYFVATTRSRFGREVTFVGLNPVACAHERIPVARRTVQAMLVSGAVAGLASSATVLGAKGYFEQGLGAGVGFSGLAVALIAKRSVPQMVFVALLFGTLQQGGLAINAHVPKEAMEVLFAVVIIAVALLDSPRRPSLSTLLARRRSAPEGTGGAS
jgi:simple sugar transport system permease protein